MRANSRSKQQGAIIVLAAVAMFALLAISALALDGGHLLLSKSRLQSAVDAAALNSAKTITVGGATHEEARLAAIEALRLNFDSVGYGDFSDEVIALGLTIQYSLYPDPFEPVDSAVAPDAPFVRVVYRTDQLTTFLGAVYGASKRVSASAVAGPFRPGDDFTENPPPEVCKITPLMFCAKGSDPSSSNGWGYGNNNHVALKLGAGSSTDESIGPGNFQLIRLDEFSSGANDTRDALAGAADVCLTPGEVGNFTVETEPGATIGPVAQGINTRMGEWLGPLRDKAQYPRDKNICQTTHLEVDSETLQVIAPSATETQPYRHQQYQDHYRQYNRSPAAQFSNLDNASCQNQAAEDDWDGINGIDKRREIAVVIGDCSDTAGGSTTFEALGIGCFFLTQKVPQGNATEAYIVGEFLLTGCQVGGSTEGSVPDGVIGGTPNDVLENGQAYKIILYNDSFSHDS